MCSFTTLTKLLVKTHSCYLEPQTKKEVRAKGQRKKPLGSGTPPLNILALSNHETFGKTPKYDVCDGPYADLCPTGV